MWSNINRGGGNNVHGNEGVLSGTVGTENPELSGGLVFCDQN